MLGAGVVLGVYLLGLQLVSRRLAVGAALLVFFDPGSALYCSLMLTETLFTALLVAAALLLLRALRTGSIGSLAFAGFALGSAALCRPVGSTWRPF